MYVCMYLPGNAGESASASESVALDGPAGFFPICDKPWTKDRVKSPNT